MDCVMWMIMSYLLGTLTVVGGYMVWLQWTELDEIKRRRDVHQ